MSTSQLALYNGALLACGEPSLSALTEVRASRYALDEVWADGAVNFMLQQGLWKFASRTARIVYESSITPGFGYKYAFEEPDDYVRLIALASDEYFVSPLNSYQTDADVLFCDLDTIYMRYVSNDASYGLNFGNWSPAFTDWAKYYLARKISPRVVSDFDKVREIKKDEQTYLRNAKSKDAFEQGTKFMPPGSWVMARRNGNVSRRYDRARG